jgi:alkanesulfonate monooxygenase SsuD/methylene tetrahydromethanopterin reductase-like flavin-dependent oxidoreductase (luciferase family)
VGGPGRSGISRLAGSCLPAVAPVRYADSDGRAGAADQANPHGAARLSHPLRHPIELARRILTVDHLSHGRLIFAAGVGGGAASAGGVKGIPGAESEIHHKEFRDVGIPRQERGGRTNEILECLKLLWTQPSASFHGKYFQFENVVMEPKPYQKPHPPIWVGGNSEAAIQRTARYGTGWVPSFELSSVMFGTFPAAVSRLREVMKEHGREKEPVHISVCMKVNINPDAKAAREDASKFWAAQLHAIEGGMPFEVKAKYGVYGTPEALVDRLVEVKAMGVDSVILHLHSFDLKSQLRRLEEKVLSKS